MVQPGIIRRSRLDRLEAYWRAVLGTEHLPSDGGDFGE